eukprot:Pgem_evm1s4492
MNVKVVMSVPQRLKYNVFTCSLSNVSVNSEGFHNYKGNDLSNSLNNIGKSYSDSVFHSSYTTELRVRPNSDVDVDEDGDGDERRNDDDFEIKSLSSSLS